MEELISLEPSLLQVCTVQYDFCMKIQHQVPWRATAESGL